MHDYWMIRDDNILNPSVHEIKSVTNAMKAYRAKVVTPKKKTNALIEDYILPPNI